MEPVNISIASETLLDVFKFLTYSQLVNCRSVCSKWSKMIEVNRYYLCCPFIYSLNMSATVGPAKFNVTSRPDCLNECKKTWTKDDSYIELLDTKVLPTMPAENKVTLSFTWPPSRQHLIDYASREFILTCANELTCSSLPHILHWFKHFRDHDAFIEQVSLLGFSLSLWNLTFTGSEHETIRCKFFTFQHFDEENLFIQMIDFLMRHVRSQDTVIEFHPQDSLLNGCLIEDKLIHFLFHGSKTATGQIIVFDFISDSFMERFIAAFESLANTNLVIPAINFSFATRELRLHLMFEKKFKRKMFAKSVFDPTKIVTKNVYEFVNSNSGSVLEVFVENQRVVKTVDMYLKYLL